MLGGSAFSISRASGAAGSAIVGSVVVVIVVVLVSGHVHPLQDRR